MKSKGQKNDEPVFLLRGEDDEIYFIDDPDMIGTLEAIVKSMKGKSEKEISRELLAIVNPENYGKKI